MTPDENRFVRLPETMLSRWASVHFRDVVSIEKTLDNDLLTVKVRWFIN